MTWAGLGVGAEAWANGGVEGGGESGVDHRAADEVLLDQREVPHLDVQLRLAGQHRRELEARPELGVERLGHGPVARCLDLVVGGAVVHLEKRRGRLAVLARAQVGRPVHVHAHLVRVQGRPQGSRPQGRGEPASTHLGHLLAEERLEPRWRVLLELLDGALLLEDAHLQIGRDWARSCSLRMTPDHLEIAPSSGQVGRGRARSCEIARLHLEDTRLAPGAEGDAPHLQRRLVRAQVQLGRLERHVLPRREGPRRSAEIKGGQRRSAEIEGGQRRPP